MDEHRHKILVILVYFMVISQDKKHVPSFTTKHIRSLTKGEENEEK